MKHRQSERCPVVRISLAWVVECFSAIHDLQSLDKHNESLDCLLRVLGARAKLDELYQSSVYVPFLRASATHARRLNLNLAEFQESIDLNKPVDFSDRARIAGEARTFLSIVSSEIGVVPTYLVTQKEGFDVNLLTEQGERLFPEQIVLKVEGVTEDMREVGKALVFELPTACGFHVFRVLEAVLKGYWDHVSNGEPRPKLETIGSYAKQLKDKTYGDAKVWETLEQIAKLHRNPLIHPEVILTTEEAIEILGIARSAIGAMVRVMPDLPTTTSGAP